MVFCVVFTAEIKPVKPGFSIAHKSGFTGLKNGRVTRIFGYPGTRVAFPSARITGGDAGGGGFPPLVCVILGTALAECNTVW